MTRSMHARPTLVAFLLAGAAALPAQGDTYGYFSGIHDCYMFVHGMPDFDQKRDAAPGILGLAPNDDGEGGAMFCVPTAATDLLGYANRHGYPDAYGPGNLDFQSGDVGVYNDVTTIISSLGALMGTDGHGGTSGSLIRAALQFVLDFSEPGAFDVYSFYRQEDWAPKSWDMAQYALSGGAVMFCYGRWNMENSAVLGTRDGGHCVALTRVDHRDAFHPDFLGDIGYANPSNSSNTTTQASFNQQNESVINDLYFKDGESLIMTRILFDTDPDDERFRLIDSVYVVYPREGFSTSIGGDGLNFWGVHTGSTGGYTLDTYTPPDSLPIGSFAILPDRTHIAVQTQSIGVIPGNLFYVNLNSNEATHVAQAGQGRGVVFGDDRTLWLLDGNDIVGFDMDNGVDVDDYQIWRQNFGGNATPDAVAYDDERDELVVLSAQTGELFRYPVRSRTLGNPTIATLPGAQFNPLSVEIEISPFDGSVWIGDLSDNSITQYVQGGTNEWSRGVRLAGGRATDLGGFSIANDGRLYVGQDGEMREYLLEDGQLVPVESGPLSRMSVGSILWVTRGRTNFDPQEHDGPGWNNVLPSEVETGDESPFCRVDYAAPFGQTDFSDVLAFLTMFAGAHPDADLAAPIGQHDFSDIIRFLTEFGEGCP